VLDQQIPKPPDRVAAGYLIGRIHPAKLRKRTAVDRLLHHRHVRKIVQILQDEQPKHQLQIERFIAALPFIIVRPDQPDPRLPRHDPLDLFQKFFLVRSCLRQLVAHCAQRYLFFHSSIISLFSGLGNCAVLP
jgi:hypothetical protein